MSDIDITAFAAGFRGGVITRSDPGYDEARSLYNATIDKRPLVIARCAELDVVAAGPAASEHAIRELLALQASDWAFMLSRRLAGPYPAERAAGHRERLHAELEAPGGDAIALRNLARHASRAALLQP